MKFDDSQQLKIKCLVSNMSADKNHIGKIPSKKLLVYIVVHFFTGKLLHNRALLYSVG